MVCLPHEGASDNNLSDHFAIFSATRDHWNRLRNIDRHVKDPYGWLSRFGVDTFVELIHDHFADEEGVISYCCQALADSGHPDAAERVRGRPPAREDSFRPRCPGHLELPLGREDVVWVSDEAGALRASEELSRAGVVGIDCESGWVGDASRAALVQVATEDRCYIFDMLALADAAPMRRLLRDLLCGEAVKLGFDCAGDMALLGCAGLPLRCVVDLQRVWTPGKKAPLRDLVRAVFRLPLCKAEQCSNWSRRPLRESQAHYAALDAWCLLRCGDHLARERSCITVRAMCGEVEHDIRRARAAREAQLQEQAAKKSARTSDFADGLMQRVKRAMSQRDFADSALDALRVETEPGARGFTARLCLGSAVLQSVTKNTRDGAQISCLKSQLMSEHRAAESPGAAARRKSAEVSKLLGAVTSSHEFDVVSLSLSTTPSGAFAARLEVGSSSLEASAPTEEEAKMQCLQLQIARDRDAQARACCYVLRVDRPGYFPLRLTCCGGHAVVKGHDPKLPGFPKGVSRGDVLLCIGPDPVHADVGDLAAVESALLDAPRPLLVTFGSTRPELSII